MKTLGEVIKANECCDHGEPDSRCEDCPYNGLGACCQERESDALHYLKEYKVIMDICHKHGIASIWGYVLSEAEKTDWNKKLNFDNVFDNNPLTWDELKQMESKPVWVEQCNGDTKGWLLIFRINYDVITCTTKHGNSFYLYKSSYGEKWQAYRKERE